MYFIYESVWNFCKENALMLGSYDVLIGMDWLEQNWVVLNCFDKTFTYFNEGEQ